MIETRGAWIARTVAAAAACAIVALVGALTPGGGPVAGAAPPQALGQLGLAVADTADGPAASSVTVNVAALASSGARPLFLRTIGAPGLLDDLRITGEVAGMRVRVSAGGRDAAQGVTAVPPDTLALELAVEAAPATLTRASGRLLAARGDVVQPLAELVVVRQTPPKITVAGADPVTGLRLSTRSSNFEGLVTLVANEAGATKLSVQVDPLRAESGELIDVTAAPAVGYPATTIEPLSSLPVQLVADLPSAGTYTTTLTVVHDGVREAPTPLTVNRVRAAPSLDVFAPAAAAHVGGFGAGPARLELSLRETSGQSIRLAPPTLVGLTRNAGTTAVDARAERIRTEAIGEDGVPHLLTDRISVKGGSLTRLRVLVNGIRSPGRYSGTVLIAEPGGLAIDRDVVIFVRWPFLLAGGLSVLGVLGAFAARQAHKRRRRRRALAARVEALGGAVAEAEAALNPPGRADPLGARLGAALAREHASLAKIAGGNVVYGLDGRFAALEARLRVARRVTRLCASAAACGEAGRLDGIDELAARAEQAVAGASMGVDELEELERELRAAEERLAPTVAGRLRDEIRALRAAAADATLDGAPGRLVDASHRRLVAHDVLPALDEAQRALGRRRLAEAAGAAAKAHGRLAAVLAADLAVRVDAAAPAGVDPARWRQARHAAAAALGLEPAALLEAELADADPDPGAGPAGGPGAALSGSPASPAAARYERARAALERTLGGAAPAVLPRATAAREERVRNGASASAEVGEPDSAAPALVALAPLSGLAAALSVADRGPQPAAVFDAQARREARIDGLVAGLAAAAAIVLCWRMLYAGNLTWGAGGDVLVAVLLGVGLQLGADVAVERLSLIEPVTPGPPAP